MYSLYPHVLARPALASATYIDGVVDGTAIDMSLFNNDFRSIVFVVQVGTVTDGSYAIAVEESANGTTGWAAVSDNQMQGSLPAIEIGGSDTVYMCGVVVGDKLFYRLTVTGTDATGGGVFSALALLGHGSNNPVNRA